MYNLFYLIASSANGVNDIEGNINSFSIRAVGWATIVLVVLLAIAAKTSKKKKYKGLKKPLFLAISSAIILPSLLLIGSTIYVNTISESKGPVHWHTDLEFWVCNQEVELRDPFEFLSNKVGTATYHEHDDKRMHLEGVVIERDFDASLEKFMAVTGGAVTKSSIIIPTNNEDIFENDTDGDTPSGDRDIVQGFKKLDGEGRAVVSVRNGDSCGGQFETETELQAFLLRYDKDSDTYTQTKLDDPRRYVMRDESIVPPGDCVIVEFGAVRSRTDKLCLQYGVRDSVRCTEFGVKTYDEGLCSIEEVVGTPSNVEESL